METTIYHDTTDPSNPGWAWRHRDEDGAETSGQIDDLDDLLDVLLLGGEIRVYHPGRDYAHDMTDLPTFGGPEVEDTQEVWSWDESRMIVGTCRDDMEIVARGQE